MDYYVRKKTGSRELGTGAEPFSTVQQAAERQSGQYVPDNYGAPAFNTASAQAPKFEEIADDDDLPF